MPKKYQKPVWWSDSNHNDCYDKFPYLARQIAGPVAGSLGFGVDSVYEKDYDFIDWLSKFSIDNLSGEWLDKLGIVVGLPRPWATYPLPTDSFQFDTVGGVLDPKKHGFSTDHDFSDPNTGKTYVMTDGGKMYDIHYTFGSVKISDALYREYLVAAGLCKRKHSMTSIAKVVELFVKSYRYCIEFSQVDPGDINIRLSGTLADYADSLQSAFDAMFTSAPKIRIIVDAYFERDFIQPEIQAIADAMTGDNTTEISYFYNNYEIYFVVALDLAHQDLVDDLQKALDEKYDYMSDLHITVTLQDQDLKFDYKPPVLDGLYHGYSTDHDMTVHGETVTTNDGGQMIDSSN